MTHIKGRSFLNVALLSVVLAACGSAATDADRANTAQSDAPTITDAPTTTAPAVTSPAATAPAATTTDVVEGHESIEVNSLELAYECQGSGSPAVVIAHGLAIGAQAETYDATWAGFRPTIEALSELTTVCIYARPGVGGSDTRIANPQTAQVQANDLLLFADAVGIDEPMIVLGYSWGGLIAQLLAHQNPDLIAGILLLESSHPGQDDRMGTQPPPPLPPEHIDIPASLAEVGVVDDLGDLPLFVLTAADPRPGGTEAMQLVWIELQEELAALSTDSKHEAVPNADHLSIPGRSAPIAAAVQDLIERIETNSNT